MSQCTALTKKGDRCVSHVKLGETVCAKHMIYQTELTIVGEPIGQNMIRSFIEKSRYGKWQDIVIDKTNGVETRYALTNNKPNVFWTVWNIGNYKTLLTKFPNLSLFRNHFEMELSRMKEHGQCVLVYDTERHPFKDDPYLDSIEEISIRLKVYLFHLPCNLSRYLQLFTRRNRNDPFNPPKNFVGMTTRHGTPYQRYQQKRGDNNDWDIFSKDPGFARYFQ